MKDSDFDKMDVGLLEEKAKGYATVSSAAQKGMVRILFYLKTSGRYKESKGYERATFYDYIGDKFGLKKHAYLKLQKAFTKFPDETAVLGVGVVSSAIEMCGTRAKSAINEMYSIKNSGKKIDRTKIMEVIERNKKPRTDVRRECFDWRQMYKTEVANHEKTKTALKYAMERNAELEAQVARLKKTALKNREASGRMASFIGGFQMV